MAKDTKYYQENVVVVHSWVNPVGWSSTDEPTMYKVGDYEAYPFRTEAKVDANGIKRPSNMVFVPKSDFEALELVIGDKYLTTNLQVKYI